MGESDDDDKSVGVLPPEEGEKEKIDERRTRTQARVLDPTLGEGGGRKQAIPLLPPPLPMRTSIAERVMPMSDDDVYAIERPRR